MAKGKSRTAGIFYLGAIVLGMTAQIIRSNILVFDENINTFERINNSMFLLRLAFINDLVMIVFYLLTAWTFTGHNRNIFNARI